MSTKLVPGQYKIVAPWKSCGTPGCCLPDWHSGLHDTEKCRRFPSKRTVVAKCLRRSPRFRTQPFPWLDLPNDLQIAVLLKLSDDSIELLRQLSKLARFLRPIRPLILGALRIDARLMDLLDKPWRSSTRKSNQETNPSLTAEFTGVHELDTREPVEEVMAVELILIRPYERPRSWKWRLRIRFHATGVPLDDGDEIELAFLEVWYTPGTRLGQPRMGTRERAHSFCMGMGRQLSAGTAQLHANHICVGSRYGCPIWHPQLVTPSSGILELRSFSSRLFRWQVSPELVAVMQLVSAFVK